MLLQINNLLLQIEEYAPVPKITICFLNSALNLNLIFDFRIEKSPNEKPNNVINSKPLSKSSDWTEVDLEVPEHEEPIHLTNPKLNLIFNTEKGTPTPPPRKHKKNLREKIEAVAKSGKQIYFSFGKILSLPNTCIT